MISLQAYNRIWACGRQILAEAKAYLAQLVLPNICKGGRLADMVQVWACKDNSPLDGWAYAECTVPEDSFCTGDSSIPRGSKGG